MTFCALVRKFASTARSTETCAHSLKPSDLNSTVGKNVMAWAHEFDLDEEGEVGEDDDTGIHGYSVGR